MLFRRTDKYGYSRYHSNGGPAYVLKIVVSIALVLGLVVGGVPAVIHNYNAYVEAHGALFKMPELSWGKTENAEQSATEDQPEQSKTEETKPEETKTEETKPEETKTDEAKPAEDTQPAEQSGFGAWLSGLFGGGKAPSEEGASSSESSATSSNGASSATGSASAVQEQEPELPPRELSDGQIVQHVTIRSVSKGEAKYDVDDKGANGIMLYMKESGGVLNYESKQELAIEGDVNTDEGTDEAVRSTIQQLKEDGYYTVAFVDCFQDEKFGTKSDYKLYDEGGSSWYDSDGRAWVNPANKTYQKYLVALVKELAELGYDEVVLKNAHYPLTGDTSILSEECYDSSKFSKYVNRFYERLANALGDSDTIVSVVSTPDAILKGKDKTSGQTLENMKQLRGRIWLDKGEVEDVEALQSALKEAGYADNALALMTDEFDSDSSVCQMNLD